MKIPAGLWSFLTRKPTLIAIAGVTAVAILGGVALALQPNAGKRTSTSTAHSQPCTPHPKASPRNRLSGRVTAVTPTSITVQDSSGTLTFALTPNTKVTGPKRVPLPLSSVVVGDYVVVQLGRRAAGASPAASPPPGAATQSPPAQPGAITPSTPAQPGARRTTVVSILDYGATPPSPKASPRNPSTICPTPSG